MDEPQLDITDIQGHILSGFGRSVQWLIGIRLIEGTIPEARQILLKLAERVTDASSAHVQRKERAMALTAGLMPDYNPTLNVAISFSAEGLRRLRPEILVPDPLFQQGAAASASGLGDAVDSQSGQPLDWVTGDLPETTPDVFVVIASQQGDVVDVEREELKASLAGIAAIVFDQRGEPLAEDKEHFGFVDGISQPAIRGTTDGSTPISRRWYPPDHPLYGTYARPGQPLIWPGQFVFGYPLQHADSPEPDVPSGGGDPWLKNGSLLVFRRLRQHVKKFKDAMDLLASEYARQGVDVRGETVAAWCVGRWPDGTPVSLSPTGPDPSIAGDFIRKNGFLFDRTLSEATLTDDAGNPVSFPGAGNDPKGLGCPFFGHIRKVNPRDQVVDQGSRGVTLQAQMLRRGVTYGEPWDGERDTRDRGLLFLSYQTSIEHQFTRLMTLWANNAAAPPPGEGIDPIIGVSPRPLTRRIPSRTALRAMLPGNWVTATGAGYFFAPGIKTLKAILRGPEA